MPSFPFFLTQLKNSDKYSDVSFLVGDDEIHAHRAVLDLRALRLLEHAIMGNDPIELPKVSLKEFQDIIHFVYTNNPPQGYDDLDSIASLLKVADRFACTDLKMELEATVVEKFLDKSNSTKLLLFADSHTCALLTEASTEVIYRNGAEIMKELSRLEVD